MMAWGHGAVGRWCLNGVGLHAALRGLSSPGAWTPDRARWYARRDVSVGGATLARMMDADGRHPDRVGPTPEPPPDRLTAWIVLDLLATARRWRARDQFIAGRVDALGAAVVACLNAGQPIPRWLRQEVVGSLLDHLWEYAKPPDSAGASAWVTTRDALVSLWREVPSIRSELR